MKEYLTRDQLRLYSIIWERFVSSQMNNAKTCTTSVDIAAGAATFRVSESKVTDKGFFHVIKTLSSKEEITGTLPALKVGEKLESEKFYPEQHFTQGPARYTDASIVKTLEEKGIGRPSTYAPIISVLLDRYYVTRSNKQLVPTTLGKMICKILVESFPQVINEQFTSQVENQLDDVEQNKLVWNSMAFLAEDVNSRAENIGARRLHTIMETVLEDISFNADKHAGETITITRDYVDEKLKDVVQNQDLQRYIL